MNIAYSLEVYADGEIPQLSLNTLFSVLPTLPHVSGINIFTPASGSHDPYLPEEPTPALLIQLILLSPECLERMLKSDEIKKVLSLLEALPLDNLTLVQEAMQLETFKSVDKPAASGTSYLVSYHRPNTDEAGFIKHYRANHCPILQRFPGLLKLELGYAMNWKSENSIAVADKILLCEVNFSSLEDLNVSLASDIRTELREDFHNFPALDGKVTHFPMHKQTLL